MAKKLTDTFVENARKPGITWDAATTGLALKVLAGGRGGPKRVWVMQLRWPGCRVQTLRNIGIYPAMTLADARRKAEQFYAVAKSGTDPFEAEEEERGRVEAAKRADAARRQNTFAALGERYINERSANRRADADAREIRRLLVAEWGDRPVHEIAPRDVRQLIDKIKRRAPYDARNAWTHAVGIFKAAVHEELITVSPCASLDKKLLFKNAGIAPRQRTLTDDEVLSLWRATARLGYPAGPIYRLLLLTGCRVSEIADAKWGELHPDLRKVLRDAARKNERVDWSAVPAAHKLLTIPRERFKSDAEHVVPLTDAACAVLEGLPRFAGCDYIFTTTGKVPVWLSSKYKVRLDIRMLRTLRALARRRGDDPSRVRLAAWKNHDIRRVVRSNLSALQVPDHVAEMCLGHARQGLQRIYDQHRYAPEIRDALERWAARLREIAEPAPTTPPAPAKVVELDARRRRAR